MMSRSHVSYYMMTNKQTF